MNRLTNIATMSVLAIGLTALLGWWTDHAALTEWLPGIADMTFNTALCFILVALASCLSNESMLGGWNQKHTSIRLGTIAFVGLFAALSLLQDFFGIGFGIDNLLFDSHGYGLSSSYPGRMSPNTASGFLLSSIIIVLLTARKQLGDFVTITHSLILLLALLSLLGIGMNILITAVPKNFAHFASISLFTAISFLLLAISFLGVFQKQCQSKDIHSILHSGIHLMYRLKYPSKFALISIIMIIPLAILMWNRLTLLEQDIEQARLKTIGIEHIQQTFKLLKAVPEHRGMINAQLSNPAVFRNAMQQKTAQVELLFASNDIMDRQHANMIPVPDEWAKITKRWATIKANHHDPMISWRMHTEIIALLSRHLRDIGNVTLLTYDDNPTIHNLLALQLSLQPQLFEQIGQLRGQGSGFMARKIIAPKEQMALGSIASQVLLLLQESGQLVNVALQHQKNDQLETMNLEFTSLTMAFLATADAQLIIDKAFSISSEDFFREATRTLAAGYAFNHSSLQVVRRMLEQRIANSTASQYTIKLSAMLIILLMIYLFASFYQSVMNTIRALDRAAENMRTGNVKALTTLPTTDEMSKVVRSFNSIAEELIHVSSHMSAVVDYAVDGIITIDEYGTIKSFNPASEKIFSYLADEVVGKDITMLMPEKHHEPHKAGVQHYLRTGKGSVIGASTPVGVLGLRKNGEEFPMDLSINSMILDEQQMFIGMVRDTTKQHEIENQLRHAQKMEALGALVGGVAHNFNNLLAGIVGKAYLAKKGSKDRPKVIPYLESIELISHQAAEMVNQLLTFAHKDFNKKKRETPLAVLIKEGFKTAKLGVPEDITLSLNITTPNIMVLCDANQIQQVLMNMMSNACDAVANSVEKRITVTLDIYSPDDTFFDRHAAENSARLVPAEYALLSISDSGHGMDEKTMRRVFEPFFSTKEVGEGTGLGLSSAFGTITSHGGAIEIDSSIGCGTTFRVYLPLIEATEETPDDNSQTVVRSPNHETLLLVDDESLITDSMQEVLEELGYKVFTAQNGIEGLKCFKKNQNNISVVITDVVMPNMGGTEMFRSIRQINSTMPTLFITGYDQGELPLDPVEKENTLILSKPVHTTSLSHAIANLLTRNKSDSSFSLGKNMVAMRAKE